MSRKNTEVNEDKVAYETRLNACFDKYNKVLFCLMENVRSQQIHDVRRDLRGKAVLVMGKKTLQRKIVANRAEKGTASQNDKTFFEKAEKLSLLRGNTGLLFTNCEVSEILDVLSKHRVQAPARVGAIAPCDVVIPAGNTGMEPTMTSFFQALNIPTKISKGTVEIINDKKVLSTGDKVDNSTAQLLLKLKISPFYYSMEVSSVWDRGVCFTKEDLAITDDIVEKLLIEGITNITALSLGAGIPTASTFPILAVDAFKNLLSVSIATEYIFKEFGAAETRKNAKEGKLVAAATAPTATTAAPTATASKKKEPEPEPEEEDDFGMGGLF